VSHQRRSICRGAIRAVLALMAVSGVACSTSQAGRRRRSADAAIAARSVLCSSPIPMFMRGTLTFRSIEVSSSLADLYGQNQEYLLARNDAARSRRPRRERADGSQCAAVCPAPAMKAQKRERPFRISGSPPSAPRSQS